MNLRSFTVDEFGRSRNNYGQLQHREHRQKGMNDENGIGLAAVTIINNTPTALELGLIIITAYG
jgi:hypothetical protein